MADRSIMEDPAVRTFQEQRAIVGNPASQTVQSMYWSESARRKRGPPTPVASSLATPQEEIPAFDHTAPSLVQPWLLEDSAAAQVTAGTFGVQVQDQQAMEAWTCPPALPSSPALTPCPPPLPSSPALPPALLPALPSSPALLPALLPCPPGPLLCWRAQLSAPIAPGLSTPSPTPGVDPSPEEGDGWGSAWPGETPSKRLRSAGAASGSEEPAYGIPGNVPPGSLSPPLGGLSFQEQLWIRAMTAEADRRWKEAEEVGLVRGPLPINEPRPLLSHFFGTPENVADMWDSVSAAVNIPGHLLRALGNPSGLSGVAIGPPGIPRPSEFGDPTPPLAKATAAFPEVPEQPFRKPLMVEAATQTTEGETAWNQWLAKARVGKGLAEHGLRTSDFEVSKHIAECMPPLSAARESRLRDRRNHPDRMAVMLYIIHAESSYLSYRRAPRGYSDLLGGLEAKMLQPPANVWEKEVAQAWKILEASVVFRMAGVKKRADEKKARREGRASLRSATAKAAASGSARLPSTSASSSEEEACTLQLEVEAMNHVVGVQDGRMWKSLEDMVGYSLKDWRESSNTGLPADAEPASSEGPAAISVPPSPKSPGAESVAPSVAPGMVIADVFNLPRVPSPSVFRAYGVQAPPPVPKRSRLPTPRRAPGWSFGSIERASNGNGSSNGIGSFNGNGPNRAREEFQVAGSFADPSLDIFSFGSGGDLREPYRECLPGFPNSGRRSKGSDPFGPRGPRRGEQRAGVIASRSEFLVKFPELTSGRSSGESSSMENFADVSFREHVLQHVCQHVLMHVWHGSCSEHVSWHDGCCVVQTLSRKTKQKARNLKKPQAQNLKKPRAQNLKKPRAQNLKKPQAQNLREPSSFRSGFRFLNDCVCNPSEPGRQVRLNFVPCFFPRWVFSRSCGIHLCTPASFGSSSVGIDQIFMGL